MIYNQRARNSGKAIVKNAPYIVASILNDGIVCASYIMKLLLFECRPHALKFYEKMDSERILLVNIRAE